MRPAAMDGVLSPPPRPLIFQARGGPSFGHSLSKPVSLEWAVRSGPCHWGQSELPAQKPHRAKSVSPRIPAKSFEFISWKKLRLLIYGCDLKCIRRVTKFRIWLAPY